MQHYGHINDWSLEGVLTENAREMFDNIRQLKNSNYVRQVQKIIQKYTT